MFEGNENHNETEWGKKLELFIVSKGFDDPKKVMNFAFFVRWTGLTSDLLDDQTLENIHELWMDGSQDRKSYLMHTQQIAEA